MAANPLDKTIATHRSKLDSGALRRNHASLVVLQGAEIGRDFRLRRSSLVIGRAHTADVVIPDDLVSREHARIEVVWNAETQTISYAIQDLGSTNHTFVNSHRVERQALTDGDKIQVGDTVLKFVLLDDIEARFHEEIRNRITYDQLTGLLTKESLYLALEQELRRDARYGLSLAVLMMDLDHFKAVNDTHGHLAGSHVLSEVGRLIRASTRAVDVSARYGGEEFLTYLPETATATAQQVAERVRAAIERHPFAFDGTTIRITISIGIACRPAHGEDIKSLVAHADQALYRAKESGRNQVVVGS